MTVLHRILRYVKGTLDHGLQLDNSSISSLLSYTDANWDGCLDTRCSTSGYCVFLDDNLISWSAKRQPTVSKSSAEAEYWLMLFLRLVGLVTYFLSFIFPFLRPLLFIVIMLVLFICRETQFSINALNILRWTYILFGKKCNVGMFMYFMFHLDIKLPIFLPRAFLRFSLMIFDPVLASANLLFQLRGCIRIEYL